MIVYNYFLNHYHNQKMVWTKSHGTALINLILELQEHTKIQDKNQLLIQFSFFLSCVTDEHKTKGESQKFFPGLLLYEFVTNCTNYEKKRKNYLRDGKLHAPPFLIELFEKDKEFYNNTLEITI